MGEASRRAGECGGRRLAGAERGSVEAVPWLADAVGGRISGRKSTVNENAVSAGSLADYLVTIDPARTSGPELHRGQRQRQTLGPADCPAVWRRTFGAHKAIDTELLAAVATRPRASSRVAPEVTLRAKVMPLMDRPPPANSSTMVKLNWRPTIRERRNAINPVPAMKTDQRKKANAPAWNTTRKNALATPLTAGWGCGGKGLMSEAYGIDGVLIGRGF